MFYPRDEIVARDGAWRVCMNCIVFLVALLKLDLEVMFEDFSYFFIFR